jgi:hypothetical protein
VKFTTEETAFQQATADRLSIPLAEFRKLALIAATACVAERLDAGSKITLPLELEPKGGQCIPFPTQAGAEKLFPPAQIDKAVRLARQSGYSAATIRFAAVSIGLDQLEQHGSEILGLRSMEARQ